MKKVLCMLLCLLLVGCGTQTLETSTPAAEDANVLVGQNPCDVYFATGNDYYDLYAWYTSGPEFMILTREYIDPESITVTIDVQTAYQILVSEQPLAEPSLTKYEITEGEGTRDVKVLARSANDLPLYIYQNYAGMDWAQLGAQYAQRAAAHEQYDAGELTQEAYEACLAAYASAETEFINGYAALTQELLPHFYGYYIQIIFSEAEVEESFQNVHVTLGDTVYDVPIGQVNLRPSPQFADANDYFGFVAMQIYYDTLPWGPGIEKYQFPVFYAQEALTLTGLDFLEDSLSTLDILEVTVVLSDNADDVLSAEGICIPWDGQAPIAVQQGQYVGLHFVIHDERMQQLSYGAKLYPVLKFTCDGGEHAVCSEIPMTRHWPATWLLYSLGLDGMDMERYFNDYYYVQTTQTWRNEFDVTKVWPDVD